MPVNRYYSSTAVATTLTAGCGAGDSSIAVGSTTGFPASTPFTIILDKDAAAEEVVTVTNVSGLNLTVTRGADGTAAQVHSSGAKVEHGLSARDLREPQEHMAATTGVHGLTGALASTTDTQTLTNKTISGASNTISAVAQASVTGLVAALADLVADDAAEAIARAAVQTNLTNHNHTGVYQTPAGVTAAVDAHNTAGSPHVGIFSAAAHDHVAAYQKKVTYGSSFPVSGIVEGDIHFTI